MPGAENHTAADSCAFMPRRWTRNFSTRPAREFAHIGPWLRRVHGRPAVQRAFAAEEPAPPPH